MTAIIVVEPNALLRLGILQLFQKLAAEISCEGVDYTQLFNREAASARADLMLLSAPGTYEQTAELIQAGQKAYNPDRILLLSETSHPGFTLHSLSPRLAGYVSKRAPTTMLTAAINLVLAGGTCFPNPDTHAQRLAGTSPPARGTVPHRRWYERAQPLPSNPLGQTDESPQPTHVTNHASSPAATASDPAATTSPFTAATPATPQPPEGRDDTTGPALVARSPTDRVQASALSRDLVNAESRLLNLTSRQYEVLVLLARGCPIKTVSRELHISISTAKTHADTLYQRLSVHNSLAAVYEALTRGATLGLSQNPLTQLGAAQPPRLPRRPTMDRRPLKPAPCTRLSSASSLASPFPFS